MHFSLYSFYYINQIFYLFLVCCFLSFSHFLVHVFPFDSFSSSSLSFAFVFLSFFKNLYISFQWISVDLGLDRMNNRLMCLSIAALQFCMSINFLLLEISTTSSYENGVYFNSCSNSSFARKIDIDCAISITEITPFRFHFSKLYCKNKKKCSDQSENTHSKINRVKRINHWPN